MTAAVTLRTERLVLRPWRDEDLDALAALNADPVVVEHLHDPLTRGESAAMLGRLRDGFEARGWGFWAVEAPEGVVGFTGLSVPRFEAHFTPCVEVGWRLARAAWGKGYATEAARASLAHGFGALGLDEIVAFTTRGNARSQRVMERLGMTRDPGGDFDHPSIPPGHRLRAHVLYRLSRVSRA